jgi:hypothetical protein
LTFREKARELLQPRPFSGKELDARLVLDKGDDPPE